MRIRAYFLSAALIAAGLLQVAGCPLSGVAGSTVIPGSTGDPVPLGSTATVQIFSPGNVDISITGGTPVEIVWRVTATTTFATVDVFFDLDRDPTNGNELFIERGLPITETSLIAATANLPTGAYFVGVRLNERNVPAAVNYANGRLLINQSPLLTFESPRETAVFDRSARIIPTIDVAWRLDSPDATVRTQIFLDPDGTPNGNEFLLRESDSQTGDSFSFDLPTFNFDPGTYQILAIVDDGVNPIAFYAPGIIQLRARLSGYIDLRALGTEESPVQGAIFEGFNPRDNAGSFVSGTGDLDSDGFDDFIILSQFGKPRSQFNLERTGVGEAYIIFGRQQRFSGRINLNSTGTLFRGNVFTGVPESFDTIRPSRGITSFAVLSDWDNDGLREFAFGLPFTDSVPLPGAGTFDTPGYFRTGGVVVVASSTLRPDLGFPGASVISLGQIGTFPHDDCDPEDPQCPMSFTGPKAPAGIVSGGLTYYWRYTLPCFEGGVNEGSIALGCRISSNDVNDQFGEVISGHQFDGLIMSAPNRDPGVGTLRLNTLGRSIPAAGTVHLFFSGSSSGNWPWRSDRPVEVNEALAPSYIGLGDPVGADLLPHDGPFHYIIDDYAQRQTGYIWGGLNLGGPGYYVDADNAEPCFIQANLTATPNAGNTVRIYGEAPDGRLGNARSLGDFNADGLEDILVGWPLAHDGAGSVYVVFGRLRRLIANSDFSLTELTAPLNAEIGDARILDGIQIVGSPGSRLGDSQDDAGDFNNDGIGDIIIGSPLINDRRGGAVVFFGSREVINFTEREIPFDEIADRGLGVNFVGEEPGDLAGARVIGVGDIDGDSVDDILIAAPGRSVRLDTNLDGAINIDRTNCGVVYLIYGSPDLRGTLNLADVGTERLPGAVFIGRNSGDFLGGAIGELGDRAHGIGGAGDVDGDGRRDLLLSSVRASPRDRVRAGEAYLIYGEGD